MASIGDLTVKIQADASQFDRTIRRVQFDLWVMRYGWQVLAAAGMLAFGLGVVLGIVVS